MASPSSTSGWQARKNASAPTKASPAPCRDAQEPATRLILVNYWEARNNASLTSKATTVFPVCPTKRNLPQRIKSWVQETRGPFNWAHPFSDDMFDSAQLNLDESSELIRKIYEWVRMSLTRVHARERMWRILWLPPPDLNRMIAQHSSSHQRRRWMSPPNPDKPNRTHPKSLFVAFWQGIVRYCLPSIIVLHVDKLQVNDNKFNNINTSTGIMIGSAGTRLNLSCRRFRFPSLALCSRPLWLLGRYWCWSEAQQTTIIPVMYYFYSTIQYIR